MIKIKRGLDLPLEGGLSSTNIEDGKAISHVAVIGFDYVGMKPTMHVAVGDQVAKGQLVFEDKKTAGVKFTAPAAGTVVAINRGAQRVFESLVIKTNGNEFIKFDQFSAKELASLGDEKVRTQLVESGLWASLRVRPYSKVPALDITAAAVFVNAMDTNPLAADPQIIINETDESKAAFIAGVDVLANLAPQTFVCSAAGSTIPAATASTVVAEQFDGPHPAGLAGTHIHFLKSVSESRQVISVNYQDAMAIGRLFLTGELSTQRIVALSGSQVNTPRILRTQVGASLVELTDGELKSGLTRVISGSVFSGRTSEGNYSYLGNTVNQVTALVEGKQRDFMGWLSPGIGNARHSLLNIYVSRLFPKRKLKLNTNTNGSPRAMVPVGTYEQVMPLDILPTQLLRAIIVGDVDTAIKLGVLELDEEDLALCTYACPGKYEYGPILRDNLTTIEKEG
ncbi:MAG: Na(+)-translocating NADH-quinone reductase subunit A [Sinobacterium sp.]|nr:Na(+)-translocating NADH-quinone reductase subunit A [Sinobacterium sp.]